MDRIQKIISNAGYTSRRNAEKLIQEGKVFINGKKAGLGDKASAKDRITVEGENLDFERKRYIKFYKPRHVLTTLKDPGNYKTIMDFLPGIKERVYPVGRLDLDAEGLLILTNDGDFANRIMHPRYELTKIYHADLRERLDDRKLSMLKGKITLKDGPVEIKWAKLIDRNNNRIEIAIHEGRNKIVKRIFKELGIYVGKLKRVGLGNVRLDSLKPGRYSELTPKERKELLNRKVMVFGSFDLVHKGHLNFFMQAKKYGSNLIVVLARDKTIETIKKEPPLKSEDERKKDLLKLHIVNKVILGADKDRYANILKENPDVICLGHDQTNFVDGLKSFISKNKLKIEIHRLKPFEREKYSSSNIKKKLEDPRKEL